MQPVEANTREKEEEDKRGDDVSTRDTTIDASTRKEEKMEKDKVYKEEVVDNFLYERIN